MGEVLFPSTTLALVAKHGGRCLYKLSLDAFLFVTSRVKHYQNVSLCKTHRVSLSEVVEKSLEHFMLL